MRGGGAPRIRKNPGSPASDQLNNACNAARTENQTSPADTKFGALAMAALCLTAKAPPLQFRPYEARTEHPRREEFERSLDQSSDAKGVHNGAVPCSRIEDTLWCVGRSRDRGDCTSVVAGPRLDIRRRRYSSGFCVCASDVGKIQCIKTL